MKTTTKLRDFLVLHVILLIYSLGQIASKTAAAKDPFSFGFFLFLGLLFLALGVYAIAWQQIIRRMPITTAYSNKSVVIVWGMVWGALLFGETITLMNIIGALIIFAGVYLVVSDNE